MKIVTSWDRHACKWVWELSPTAAWRHAVVWSEPGRHLRPRQHLEPEPGGRSRQVQGAQLPEQADRRRHLAEKRAAIVADLGGEAALSSLQRDLVDRYVELDTVASWLGGNLVTEGPLTAKGRTRAALSAYVTVVDRVLRVSSALGLARRPRAVSLNQYLTDTYKDAGSSRS